MAIIKVGNNSIGKISVIEPYDNPFGYDPPSIRYEPELQPWTRPSGWLEMPVINSGDSKASLLFMVESGYPVKVGLQTRGALEGGNIYPTYSVINWGDGTEVVQSGRVWDGNNSEFPRHVFREILFENLPANSEITYNGNKCRQALVTVDATASGISYINLSRLAGLRFEEEIIYANYDYNSQNNRLVDFEIGSPALTSLVFYYDHARNQLLEHVKIVSHSGLSPYRFFNDCQSLRSIEIPEDIFSGQTNFYSTFAGCRELTHAPNLDTSSATGVNNMFSSCYNLIHVPDYDTSNVTDFNAMFSNCRALENYPNINTSNGVYFTSMFNSNYRMRELPDYDFSNGQIFNSFAYYNTKLKMLPGNLKFESATSMANCFQFCHDLRSADIDCRNVTNFRETFSSCNSIEKIKISGLSNALDMASSFSSCVNLKKIEIGDGENIISTGMYSLFNSCRSLEEIPTLNTSHATSLSSYMSSCVSLLESPAIDASSCTNLNSINNSCFSLVKSGGFKNLNRPERMESAFWECYSLRELPSGLFEDFNSTPARCRAMFNSCQTLKSIAGINLSGVNEVSTTNYQMFVNCTSIEDYSNITFGSGTNADYMFQNNYRMFSFSGVDVSQFYSTRNMFHNCRSLRHVDITGINNDISFYYSHMSSGSVTHLFESLETVSNKTINMQRCYGVYQLHPDTMAIATNKGWTVTT